MTGTGCPSALNPRRIRGSGRSRPHPRQPGCPRSGRRCSRIWGAGTTIAGVFLLAAIAAVVSFRYMHELCLRHGEDHLAAVLIPLAVAV
ncbi:DUF2637 domain-containing protein [Sphaerimonospora sp. CA-214678]|uniref:DUF2637 domain-containing protein n=1 Tax=Sphaerimonospora sp. CA-214678 TaxID=3240029 RepID=UPI003D8D7635